ncbi:MAG TPA: HAD family hydrolase [Chthoniobacterales bacterium]|nr:HAD family hydrolase [Chthoniobacterales bacterium]
MIKGVIFDIDGTLVDSNDLHVEAWQEAFRHFGKEFDYKELRRQVGKGGDHYLPAFLSQGDMLLHGEEINKFRSDLFRRKYIARTRAFPKVPELFERIRQDGKRIALASSGNENDTLHFIDLLAVRGLADVYTSKGDVAQSKPSTDVFLRALNLLHLQPEEAVAVGDTPFDVDAAKKIGLPIVALTCGGFSEDELRAEGAVAVYRDPADLLEHYTRSPLT